jgi:hypothetical protein
VIAPLECHWTVNKNVSGTTTAINRGNNGVIRWRNLTEWCSHLLAVTGKARVFGLGP